VRQKCLVPILAAFLALVRLPVVQAQEADASVVGSDAAARAAARYEEIRKYSEEGDAAAQYKIAERYRLGLMLKRNYGVAIELYRRSAGQGFAPSQFRLGQLYQEGNIVEQDLHKALKYYRWAAEQGHVDAQYALGQMYHLGQGTGRDMAAAITWYRKAARQGDEWSQLALGDAYRIGSAVPRDLVQSTIWYRMAAEQGNIFAQHALGDAYRSGSGVGRDITQAIAWYQLAADAGNPSSKIALSELEAKAPATETVTAQVSAPEASNLDAKSATIEQVKVQEPKPEGAEFEAKVAATERVTVQEPDPEVPKDADAKIPVRAEADLALLETANEPIETDQKTERPSEPEVVSQISFSARSSEVPASVDESSLTRSPAPSDEAMVLKLLARAKGQVVKQALTTPAGDNAFETYQQVLALQPQNNEALAGIQKIGVKYMELAKSAADKGDLATANRYAAKAAKLAPGHPLVRAMVIPGEAKRPTTEKTALTFETLAEIKAPQLPRAKPQEVSARIETASLPYATVTSGGAVQDADDLVFKPHNYEGRLVVVTGPITRFLWRYRLLSEAGQNNIVLDVEGLGEAARATLDAALEEAGAFSQIRARIKGKIERQPLATFHLEATEVALIGLDPSQVDVLGDVTDPDREITPLVVPIYPGKLFEPQNGQGGSGSRDSAGPDSDSSNEGGSSGGQNGSGSTAGAGSGGDVGDTAGGSDSGGGSSDSADSGGGSGNSNGNGNANGNSNANGNGKGKGNGKGNG